MERPAMVCSDISASYVDRPLKPFQLDALAKIYQIKTFWAQNKRAAEKKVDIIKLYLTPEERQKIHQAAQKLGFRYDNHFAKFCIEQTLKKQ